jgi:hypothetical protein
MPSQIQCASSEEKGVLISEELMPTHGKYILYNVWRALPSLPFIPSIVLICAWARIRRLIRHVKAAKEVI